MVKQDPAGQSRDRDAGVSLAKGPLLGPFLADAKVNVLVPLPGQASPSHSLRRKGEG